MVSSLPQLFKGLSLPLTAELFVPPLPPAAVELAVGLPKVFAPASKLKHAVGKAKL